MKALSEPNVTTYHYVYDANGNRTTVEIKDDGLTLESTVYTYDRLNIKNRDGLKYILHKKDIKPT